LWLKEPLPITNHLIHHITWLPYSGENPINISEGNGGDLALKEAMKVKFKLEKKKRGYSISSINNPTMKVATQILEGKVIQKCCEDEVLVLVISLVAQCAEGVQFN